MSSMRISIALVTILLLVALLAFQQHRWQLVAECHAIGGVWDGQDAKCRLIPSRIYTGTDQGQG